MIIGFYCIFSNGTVEINTNKLNNIVLTLLGSVCISICVILIAKEFIVKNRILEYWGRNTLL